MMSAIPCQITMESEPQPRWTIRKIIEGILVGVGMTLLLNGMFDLLDYCEDAEEYQKITQPVVQAVLNQSNVVNGELHYDSIPLTSKQRTDLQFDLTFFNFKNPHRSITELKYQLWGGLFLLTISFLLAGHRERNERLAREEKTREPRKIFPDDAPQIRRVTSVESDSLVKRQKQGDP